MDVQRRLSLEDTDECVKHWYVQRRSIQKALLALLDMVESGTPEINHDGGSTEEP